MLQMISNFQNMLAAAFPLVLLLTGAILHTFAPHHRMIVEERVKDREMTETEARRQIGFLRWSVPTMTIMGVLLSTLLVCDLFL